MRCDAGWVDGMACACKFSIIFWCSITVDPSTQQVEYSEQLPLFWNSYFLCWHFAVVEFTRSVFLFHTLTFGRYRERYQKFIQDLFLTSLALDCEEECVKLSLGNFLNSKEKLFLGP